MSRHVVAVIGTGAFSREHIAALRQLPDLRVAWVYGRTMAAAEEVALVAPGARPTASAADVLGDPDVFALDIVTATAGHAPWVIDAARAGKHILVDKPVCRDLTELTRVEKALDESAVSFLVGQTVRFQPAVSHFATAIHAGEIGKPRLAHISWYTGHVWPGGWRGWQHDPDLSGGHPVHNGSHAIDAAVYLLGEVPTRVFARPLRTWSSDMPTPDSFQLTLRFGDKGLAVIELCYALTRTGDSLRRLLVAGSGGTLLHSTEGEQAIHSGTVLEPPASTAGALVRQMRHWVDVLSGAEPSTTPAQVRAVLATAVAAQRSLVSGRAVDVEGATR